MRAPEPGAAAVDAQGVADREDSWKAGSGASGFVTQLWTLTHLMPWLGDLTEVPQRRLRRAFLDVQRRPFSSTVSALTWLRQSLDLPSRQERTGPTSPDSQQRVLDLLGVPRELYDFVGVYRVAQRDIYVLSHGLQISSSTSVRVPIDTLARQHFRRTGRVTFQAASNPRIQAAVSNPEPSAFDFSGIAALPMRVFANVASIPRGELRSLDWLSRSCHCPGVPATRIAECLAENPFPYVLPTHRLDGAEGWPVLAGLQLDEVRALRAFEGSTDRTATSARGGRYVVRPASMIVCEVGCTRARVGERGAFLVRDLSEVDGEYSRCTNCRPQAGHLVGGSLSRSA